MEMDRSSPEETAPASSEDQGSAPKAATARSYECIFCKRGFSNAQALGGHMNIHRKDRAKLKPQPTNDSAHFPFNISSPLSPSLMGHAPPWIVARDLANRPRQLALLVERSGRGDDRPDRRHEQVGPAVVEEVDLELRLGPERPDSSSLGFRHFL